MKISVDLIKELRRQSYCSIADCRIALEEAKGDLNKAQELLRQRGLKIAEEKKDRQSQEGLISSYVHLGGKIGVLVEVGCETDFVARNEEFLRFTKDIAMQVAACNPRFINKEAITDDVLNAQSDKSDKDEFIKQACLMEQPFIKDQAITIKDYLGQLIAKIGENISIRRFIRFSIKEGVSFSDLPK